MIRYDDCQRADGDCSACSLVNYGRDCHNNPENQLAFLRLRAGLTQQQLADGANLLPSNVSRIERGERAIENLALKTAIALADTLGVQDLRDLI
jgi:DNA-binding XRE family transcriptional regulator